MCLTLTLKETNKEKCFKINFITHCYKHTDAAEVVIHLQFYYGLIV